MIPTRTATTTLGALLLLAPAWSHAQPLGQFQWHLQPFCNVVALGTTSSDQLLSVNGNASKVGGQGAGEYVGFSAQAVREVIPEAVAESTGGDLPVNADPILGMMLNALKDLKADHDLLSARNAEPERRLAELEAGAKAKTP